MKYIMHIFAPTECVLNTDHGAFKLMKYMYHIYLVGQSFVCFKYQFVYVYKPCFLKTKQTHKDISSGTAELGGGGAGGAAAPVALYQEGQGGQRCPFNLKDCIGEIAKNLYITKRVSLKRSKLIKTYHI